MIRTFRAVSDEQRFSHLFRILDKTKTYHRIALPDDDVPGRLDSLDMSRQKLFDLVGSISADQGDLARYVVRVDH